MFRWRSRKFQVKEWDALKSVTKPLHRLSAIKVSWISCFVQRKHLFILSHKHWRRQWWKQSKSIITGIIKRDNEDQSVSEGQERRERRERREEKRAEKHKLIIPLDSYSSIFSDVSLPPSFKSVSRDKFHFYPVFVITKILQEHLTRGGIGCIPWLITNTISSSSFIVTVLLSLDSLVSSFTIFAIFTIFTMILSSVRISIFGKLLFFVTRITQNLPAILYEGSLSERQVIFSEDVMLCFYLVVYFHSSSLFSFWYCYTFTSCFHFHSCLHLKFIRWSPLFFSTSLKITWLSSYFSSLEYRWREACLCLWSPGLYGVKIVFRVPVSLPRCQISFETSEEWLINIHNDWNKLTFIQNKAIGNC